MINDNNYSAPKINNITHVNYMKPQVMKLENGINTHIIKGGIAEVIQLDLMFEAGLITSNINLLPTVSNSLLKEGPLGISPDDFSEILDFYGCIIQGYVNNRFTGIKIIFQNVHAEKIIPLISKLLKNPSLPDKEFKILQNKFDEKIKFNLEKNKFLAIKEFNTMLFGDKHPFGLVTNKKSIYDFDLNQVKEFIKQFYHSDNCSILISGMVNDSIISLLQNNFGKDSWGNTTKNELINFPINTSTKQYKLISRDDSLQSTIIIGKFLNIDTYDEVFPLSVLNTILGGYFGSRLMKNIREDKGYTYGIGSFITNFNDKYVLRIFADVGVEYTQLTIDEIFREVEKLMTSGIEKEELSLVKNYMMGDLLNSFNGPFATAQVYQKLFEEPDYNTYIEKQINSILSIDSQRIIDIAQKHLNVKDFYTIVAGKYY